MIVSVVIGSIRSNSAKAEENGSTSATTIVEGVKMQNRTVYPKFGPGEKNGELHEATKELAVAHVGMAREEFDQFHLEMYKKYGVNAYSYIESNGYFQIVHDQAVDLIMASHIAKDRGS